MTMLNVYVYRSDDHVLEQLRAIFSWRSKLIRVWFGRGLLASSSDKFRKVVTANRADKIIEDCTEVDFSLSYYEWNGENAQLVNEHGVKALFTRVRRPDMEFVILDSESHPKDWFSGFVDSKRRDDLPDRWERIRYVQDAGQILRICEERGIVVTELRNRPGYERVGVPPVKGAVVYREKSTGCYIHADTKHVSDRDGRMKPEHYEYYDSCGRHLGEKEMVAGPVRQGTADSNKTLKLHG